MQVTLNIDSAQLGQEVSEFMKTLTVNDKQNLVTEILKDYYSEYAKFDASENQLKDAEALAYVKKEDYYSREGKKSEEEMRKTSYYADFMKKQPTMAEKIRREISSLVQTELSKTVREFVDKDDTYKKLVEDSMATVKAQFPILVQQAMVQHMAGQLPMLVTQLQQLASGVTNQMQDMNQRLLNRGF